MTVSRRPSPKRLDETGLEPSSRRKAETSETWHLARNKDEQNLAAFEFSLERAMHGYYRWKGACLAAVCGDVDGTFSGNDTAVLNVIRMKDLPKGLSEICRLLNRDDTANIQYSLRKLTKAGLIEKAAKSARKSTVYTVTARGRTVTDAYADLRANLLVSMSQALGDPARQMGGAEQMLNLITGLYEQASKQAAARRY